MRCICVRWVFGFGGGDGGGGFEYLDFMQSLGSDQLAAATRCKAMQAFHFRGCWPLHLFRGRPPPHLLWTNLAMCVACWQWPLCSKSWPTNVDCGYSSTTFLRYSSNICGWMGYSSSIYLFYVVFFPFLQTLTAPSPPPYSPRCVLVALTL